MRGIQKLKRLLVVLSVLESCSCCTCGVLTGLIERREWKVKSWSRRSDSSSASNLTTLDKSKTCSYASICLFYKVIVMWWRVLSGSL